MKNRPRTCLGCRGKFDRKLLLRVARIINGDSRSVFIDPDNKLQGRGAWVCKNIECIEKAKKKCAFEKILKTNVIEDVYEELLCIK